MPLMGMTNRCSEKWEKGHPSEGPMPYYEWKADKCLLEHVDEVKFCRVMEGRKGLLFVGKVMMCRLFS